MDAARFVPRLVAAALACAAVVNAQANPTCTTQQSGCSPVTGGRSKNEQVNVNIDTSLGGGRRLAERRLGGSSGGSSGDELIEGTIVVTIDGHPPPKPAKTISEDEADECTSCTEFCQDVLSEFAPACDTIGISLANLEELNSDDAVAEERKFPRCDECEFSGEKPFCVEIVDDDLGHPDFQIVASEFSFTCKLPSGKSKCSVAFDLAIDGLFDDKAVVDGEVTFDGEPLEFIPLHVTPSIYEPTPVPTPRPNAKPPKGCEDRCKPTCKCWCKDKYPWLSNKSCRRKCKQKCDWLCGYDDSADFEDVFTSTPKKCYSTGEDEDEDEDGEED